MPEIHELTASELRLAYAQGELAPVEVTRALLDRIEALNPSLRAFITVCADEAMHAARHAEAALRRTDPDRTPPLFGIPVSIKDLVDVAGLPTTMGSLVGSREPAARDELFVEALRASGAIILGKTNTSEFGLAAQTINRLGEPCRNPWNLERTAGGSSGGAAAACAAGLGPIHHGTDGGGSVRVPAAYCGVVGLKPTGRRIPRWTRGVGMSQISTDGVLARSVEDAALMLYVMADPDRRDPTALRNTAHSFIHDAEVTKLDGLRIAWTTTLAGPTPSEPAVAAHVQNAASVLASAGAILTETSPEIPNPLDIFPTLSAVGAAANYGDLVEGREDELLDYTRSSLRRGRALTGIEVAEAYARLDLLQRVMAAWFEQYDALLMPTSAITAHPHGARIDEIAGEPVNPWMISILYTPLANLIQAPAIAIPAGLDGSGLPTSVQIMTRPGDEATALHCAALLEAEMPWAERYSSSMSVTGA